MPRTTNVILKQKSSNPLLSHYKIGNYDFPFTLNPTIGCFFACKYCYSPIFVAKVKEKKRKQFFETVKIKLDAPQNLDRQLTKLKAIPQHLKRVQINETSDYYLPKVVRTLRQLDTDPMLDILKVFQKHAENGNNWMLHILTKSNLILNHLDKLKEMKGMVQIEISIPTHDESVRRKIEFYTIPISERLRLIERLSENQIFVRVMAMPFYGNKNDVREIRRIAFNSGAKAFKNKSLNYFLWEDLKNITYDQLINDEVSRTGSRQDTMYEDLNKLSGELYILDGRTHSRRVLMPKEGDGRKRPPNWATKSFTERIERKSMKIINCGYSLVNDINWGYIL